MLWNHLQLQLIPEDLLGIPTVGAGGMTRDEALAEIQTHLDHLAAEYPPLLETAALWRLGVKDDTVYWTHQGDKGQLIWAVYGYDEDDTPQAAATRWIEDFAEPMRAAGLDVQIARPR